MILPIAPAACPLCAGALQVERYRCADCAMALEGRFAPDPLAALTAGERAFALEFLRAGGNLKALGAGLGVSYPTLRARLDELIERLGGAPAASRAPRPAAPPAPGRRPAAATDDGGALARKERILALIESGAISAAEGKARLRGER